MSFGLLPLLSFTGYKNSQAILCNICHWGRNITGSDGIGCSVLDGDGSCDSKVLVASWWWWVEMVMWGALLKKKQRLVVVHVNSKGKFEVNHSCSQLKWIPDEWHEVDHPLKKNTHAYCREYSFQRKRVTTHNARNPGMWIMANVKNFRVPEGNKQKQEKIKTSGEVSSLYRQNN